MNRPNTLRLTLVSAAVVTLALLASLVALLAGTGPDATSTTAADAGETPSQERREKEYDAPANDGGIVNASEKDVAAIYATPSEWEGQPFASSIQGTEIDGSLRADAQGRLLVDMGTRDFFDYFMNTAGDVGEEKAMEQIREMAEAHLPESAAVQAMDLLGQYIDYKEKAVEISRQPLPREARQSREGQLKALRGGLDKLKQARREAMSPDAVDAFFSMEEAYSDFTLRRMAIENNSNLSRQEKQQQLRLAREQLPTAIRQTEQHQEQTRARQQKVRETLANASSPEQAEKDLKELGLDAGQVENLVEQMRADKTFERAYAAYKNEREEILESGLSTEDRQEAIESLRQKHFDSRTARSKARYRDGNSGG